MNIRRRNDKWIGLMLVLVLIMPVLGAAKGFEAEYNVAHLFTHALIAHPDVAFKSGNEMAKSYDTDCLTPIVFKRILQSLYERNYRLTDIQNLYQKQGDGIVLSRQKFPKGIKPLVLSFDDINYYRKKMYMGMADKLILENGRFATYSRYAENKISYDNDVVPIVENFIEKHPDFCIGGARPVLNLTGFDGILGYRTDRNSPNRKAEIAAVKPIIAELKARGWRFASHSYGHYHMTKIADAKFFDDADKFRREVKPLLGETVLYVYPYGEYEEKILQSSKATPKHRKLLNEGYRFFMGVGGKSGLVQFQSGGKPQIFMDRVPMDGNTMRRNRKVLSPFFDVDAVYDAVRPTPLKRVKK